MAQGFFSDLMIKSFNDDEMSLSLEETSANSLLSNHFSALNKERIDKNNKIYQHVQKLRKLVREISNLDELVNEHPFPDNNCKLAFLKLLKIKGDLLQFASEELRNDEMVVMVALERSFSSSKFIGDKLKMKREFILKIVKLNSKYSQEDTLIEHLPEYHNDDEIMKLAIQQQPKCLKFASERIKNCREIVLEAVQTDGLVLEFIPDHLKDREIVIQAINNSKYHNVLQYATAFADDKEIVLLAAKKWEFSLSNVSEKLRDDRDFVLQIVKLNGDCLKDVSTRLNGDEEIVRQAVKSNSIALFHINSIHNFNAGFVEEIVLTGTCQSSIVLVSRIAQKVKYNREFILKCISGGENLLTYLGQPLYPDMSSDIREDIDFFNELIDIQCDYYMTISSNRSDSRKYFQSLDEEKQLRIVKIDPMCLIYCRDELKNNRQLILDSILLYTNMFRELPKELSNDREIMRLVIKEYRGTLEYASEELKNDKSFLQEALVHDLDNIIYASEELKADEEILEFVIGREATYFEYAPESWKNSRDLVLKAIRNSTSCISDFLGYTLREDRDLTLEYVKRTGEIEDIPQEFKQDREIVLEAIQIQGYGLLNATPSLQKDRELILIALRNYLGLNSINCKLDREIVYEACKIDGKSLESVPEEYRDDERIVTVAVLSEMGRSSFKFASERLRNDIQFVRKLIKLDGSLLEYLPTKFRNNREIVMDAINQESGASLINLSEDLKNDKELILTGLKHSAKYYGYTSEKVQNDSDVLEAVKKWLPSTRFNISIPLNREIVLIALNIKSLVYFDYNYRDDRQFALLAVNANIYNLTNVSNRLRLDRTFILEINPKKFGIEYIPIALRQDREIALKFLERNGQSIIYLSNELKDEFKRNREIMLKAIKSNAIAFLYASEELQNDEEFILECSQLNGMVLKYVNIKFSVNRNIVMKCVQNHESALQYVGDNKFLNDKEIVMAAAQSAINNGTSFSTFSNTLFEMRNDPEIVLKAVQSNVELLLYATYEIITDEKFIEKAMDINIEALCYAHYSLRYNSEFVKRMNKNNRIVQSGGLLYRKFLRAIDFDSLLQV